MPSHRPLRPSSRLLRVALLVVVSGLLFEGLVRGILFHGWFRSVHAVANLRRERAFAGPHEDEFYELRLLLRRDQKIPEPNLYDPVVGWRSNPILTDYDHRDRGQVGSQRPVLLFGDSYAAGVIDRADCFEALFEDTHLADSMELLNYGCGGYGLDQICLLVERAVPLWVEQRPIVLVSLLLDDDLDRCRLALRPWPKPRFRVADGRLELEREGQPLPSTAEHMSGAFPPGVSWAWRLLLHCRLLPDSLARSLSGEAASEQRARVVNELLLERIIADLRARDLTFGFVLFSNRNSIYDPAMLDWRETLVERVLARHAVPFVRTRDRLALALAGEGVRDRDYFIVEGHGKNHMTRLGNQTALVDMVALIERLVAGEPHRAPGPRPLALDRIAGTVLPGARSAARYERNQERLALRVGQNGPTEVRYELEAATILRAEAWIPAGANSTPGQPGSVDLTVLADGRALFAARLERGAPPAHIELDLSGASTLVIRAGDGDDGVLGDVVVLGRPRPR